MSDATDTTRGSAPFNVGEFLIDPGLNTVHGPDGRRQIEPKAMLVLVVLYRRAGETVSREDLLNEVWSGRVVVEETLTRIVSQLRQAFGERGQQRNYIQTVPKRGYRLVAPVDSPPAVPAPNAEVPPGAAKPANRPGMRFVVSIALVLLAVVLVGVGRYWTQLPSADDAAPRSPPSLAVLPFEPMDANIQTAFLADGVAEELLNALASVSELRVPSRYSSFAFRGEDLSLTEIAAALEVRFILEGSVRRSGDQVRINARLVEVAGDSTLWSRQYDGDLARIFEVQEEIATEVLGALQGTLLNLGTRSPDITRSASVDAYSLYLQGNYYWMNGTTSSWFYQARDAFEQAIELDPEFAAAHASLGYIYARHDFHDQYMPREIAVDRSEKAIAEALRIDGNAVDAYHARAILATARGQFDMADDALAHALRLDPRSSVAHYLYSELHLARNEPDKALAAANRSLDIDPLSPWVNVNKGIVLFQIGDLEAASDSISAAIRLDPDYTWAYVWQSMVYHAQGRLADAVASMHRCLALDPASESNAALLGLLYLDLGDTAAAQRWFEQAASLQGDGNQPRLWGRMVSLAFERDDDDILLAFADSAHALKNSRYSLIPVIYSAYLQQGQGDDARQLLIDTAPELAATSPHIRPADLSAAVLLAAHNVATGMDNPALLDAISQGIAAVPGVAARQALIPQLHLIRGEEQAALNALNAQLDQGWLPNVWLLLQSPVFAGVADTEGFRQIRQRLDDHAAEQAARLVATDAKGAAL